MSLRELYQEMIVDHGKQPRNKGKLENPSCMQLGHNPLCGDKLIVYIMAQDNIVVDIRFEGEGSAISMASASLMTEAVKGKALADVEILFQNFHLLVTKGDVDAEMGKLAIFAGVAEFPARVKCASLAWHTLKAALDNENQAVSTE